MICELCGASYVPCPVCGQAIHPYQRSRDDWSRTEYSDHMDNHVAEGRVVRETRKEEGRTNPFRVYVIL